MICNNRFIGGGESNAVSGEYSAILGGCCNLVSGNCSVILGGCDNVVTHNWAAAFGCGVASTMDCAFVANNVVVQDIPSYTGSPKLLQYVVAPAILGLAPGTCLVVTA